MTNDRQESLEQPPPPPTAPKRRGRKRKTPDLVSSNNATPNKPHIPMVAPRQKLYNIYNIVAGKFRTKKPEVEAAKLYRFPTQIISPDEYLFDQNHINYYPLLEPPELPSSEIVHAVHKFMSDRAQELGLENTLDSYDSTALLALAIEVEERIKSVLAPQDHLLFAKSKEEDVEDSETSSIDISSDEESQPKKLNSRWLDPNETFRHVVHIPGTFDQFADLGGIFEEPQIPKDFNKPDPNLSAIHELESEDDYEPEPPANATRPFIPVHNSDENTETESETEDPFF